MIKIYASVKKLIFFILVSVVNVACVTDSTTLVNTNSDAESKAKAYSELAANYINVGKYEIAQNELKKAFSADPDYLGSYYVAGVLALKLGSIPDAEKNFRIAAKDSSKSIASHELGVLLCRTGRAEESIQYFDQAISNPLFANRGMSNLRAGECISRIDLKKAESYFNAALVENPNITVALYRLSEVYYAENQLLRARAYLERFEAKAKPSPQALYLGYQIENKAKSVKSASSYSERLMKQFPGSKEAKSLRKQLGLRG